MTSRPVTVETLGLETVDGSQARGRPTDLFWPWFAANVSVLAVSYGPWLLGYGISFAQAVSAVLIGVLGSFLLVGLASLAGRRGAAPTMVLTRAALGVDGSRVMSVISWLFSVGWEIVSVTTATLAAGTVAARLGWPHGRAATAVTVLVLASLVVVVGVYGYGLIMRVQRAIAVVTAAATIGYAALAAPHIRPVAMLHLGAGTTPAVVGATIFVMTAFGLGWMNEAADYSRYLPADASGPGIVGWTMAGASTAPILLTVLGFMLAGSDPGLSRAVSADPVGALAQILPGWFLVPFALVAVLGLVSAAIMNIYSSGFALLGAGLPVSRPVAAAIDGALMMIGCGYLVFGAPDFFTPFQGFLTTLGVPIAAWTGIFLADLALRRRTYDGHDLHDATGRYGGWRPVPLVLLAAATAVGWGLVTNDQAAWLTWQGYLLGPLGGRPGAWARANLGVLAALLIGFVGTLCLSRGAVRRQERR